MVYSRDPGLLLLLVVRALLLLLLLLWLFPHRSLPPSCHPSAAF